MGTRAERLAKKHATWSREDLTSADAPFPVDPKDIVICVLHARLRIADEFMEVLTARLCLEPGGIERLRQTALRIGVPFQFYDEEGESVWRITSYNGAQAQQILNNIHLFAQLWPSDPEVDYSALTIKSLNKEIWAAINKGSIRKPRPMPTRKGDLIALLQQPNNNRVEAEQFEKVLYTTFHPHLISCKHSLAPPPPPPPHPPHTHTHKIWQKLACFLHIVSDGPSNADEEAMLENWDAEVEQWKADFALLHRLREMRVYPHIIMDHGQELYLRHGPMSKLSQQGMEHANKRDVHAWNKHTQRGGGRVSVCFSLIPFPIHSLYHSRA